MSPELKDFDNRMRRARDILEPILRSEFAKWATANPDLDGEASASMLCGLMFAAVEISADFIPPHMSMEGVVSLLMGSLTAALIERRKMSLAGRA